MDTPPLPELIQAFRRTRRGALAILLGATLLSGIAGCTSISSPTFSSSTTTESLKAPSLTSALKTQELIHTYGLSPNTTCAPYLEARLKAILPQNAPPFAVTVLATDSPLALSPGDATILLSTGLLRRLTTEGDVLFLLMHEAAHYQLGHVQQMQLQLETSTETRRDFEYAADAYAQQRLSQGGYDPQSGMRALLAVYSHGGIPKNDPAYPSLNDRLVKLVQTEWGAPELRTRDGRGFRAACGGMI